MRSYTNNRFNEAGFLILPNIIPSDDCKAAVTSLKKKIEICAQDIQLSVPNYLRIINRWKHPSPVMECFEKEMRKKVECVVSSLISRKLVHISSDIICKPAKSEYSIPCHQDLPYAVGNPYNFSVWIPLTDVSLLSAPLEVLPGSHLDPVSPLVDFWQPGFVDRMRQSKRWEESSLSLPVQAGKGILFDSHLWHGSSGNKDNMDRFAFVTRWRIEHFQFKNQLSPSAPSSFGIHNCASVTHQLLQKGLAVIFQEQEDVFIQLIEAWIKKLQRGMGAFLKHEYEALTSLVQLRNLTKSSQLHNAGDSRGFIYQNVWHYFLLDLKRYIEKIERKEKEV